MLLGNYTLTSTTKLLFTQENKRKEKFMALQASNKQK
jgi:hypothetical protein